MKEGKERTDMIDIRAKNYSIKEMKEGREEKDKKNTGRQKKYCN